MAEDEAMLMEGGVFFPSSFPSLLPPQPFPSPTCVPPYPLPLTPLTPLVADDLPMGNEGMEMEFVMAPEEEAQAEMECVNEPVFVRFWDCGEGTEERAQRER